jgi:hypothetical protein
VKEDAMPEFDSTLEFRSLPEFPGYQIGNDGTVWSAWRKGVRFGRSRKWLLTDTWTQLVTKKANRCQVGLRHKSGRVKRTWVYILVLTAFVGPRPKGMYGLHNNDITDDNRISNLRWGSHTENMRDVWRNHRREKKERLPRLPPKDFVSFGEAIPDGDLIYKEITPAGCPLGAYRVGTDGTVWTRFERCHRDDFKIFGPWRIGTCWRKLAVLTKKDGYQSVSFGGGKVRCPLHKLVLETFVGPRPVGCIVRHRNGIPSDNRLVNLRWGSIRENELDSMFHRRKAIGCRNHLAKLKPDDVRAIRRRVSAGETLKKVGGDFGVGQTTVGSIMNGDTWAWLE